MIYDYILTHPHGLISLGYPEFRRAHENGFASLDSINPLRRICHLVYTETRGRALILNDLIFRGNGPQTGLAVFQEFYTTLNALHCALEKIHIFDSDDFSRAPED
jgi:hypothetical protein